MRYASRFRLRSLRPKILAWSFIPTAVALVGVGLVSFIAFQRTTRYLLIERNREVVHLMAVQLAGELEAYPTLLNGLAGSPAMYAGTPSTWQPILDKYHNSLVVFDGGVVLTDQHGLIVATQPYQKELIKQNLSDREYFRELIRTMDPVFSDVVGEWVPAQNDPSDPAIVIAVPILGVQNEFLGMAAGKFRLGATNVSYFYGNIVKLHMGESDQAHTNTYLVDGNGRVIYHTNDRWIGRDFQGQPAVQHLLANDFIDEFAAQAGSISSGDAGAIRTRDVQKTDIIAYFSPVPGTHWGLVSEAGWSALMNLYQSYLYTQSALFILGVLLPALLVSYRIRSITEPIYRLQTAAREVAHGNLGHTIQIRTGDELEELADQFNHMSIQLAQSYAAIEERVKERTRELATLNEISSLVNQAFSLSQVLGNVLGKAAETMGFQFGAVYRLEGEAFDAWLSPEDSTDVGGQTLFLHPLVYWGVAERDAADTRRLPFDNAGIASAWDCEQPCVWETDPAVLDAHLRPPVANPGSSPQVVTIPLKVKGRSLGAVLLGTWSVRELSAEELDLLFAISQQVGVVLENARLHDMERQQLQQTVTLEERGRLARELHDSVTQSLYSITLLAEAAARLLTAGETMSAADHLRVLRDSAQESLREMRLLIFELRPVALEKNDLADALRIRLDSVEARSGIKSELQVEGMESLSYPVKQELYQIAQESLNNVLKHSNASQVKVSLRFTDEGTCLEISDNGQGFEPGRATQSGGMGLAGLAERARKIAGRLAIDSAPGRGARIQVVVPRVN